MFSLSRPGPDPSGTVLNLKHFAAFLALHVPLAVVCRGSELAATAHALLTVLVALGVALRAKHVTHAMYMAGYIVGAEVLWRMSEAKLFWEFGKYAVSLTLLIGLVRSRQLKAPALPLLYFGLLLPAIGLTLANLDLALARQYISFNLSGPFTLLVSAWYFTRIELQEGQLQTLLACFIGPIIGIGVVTALNVFTGEGITFTTESNFETTGGFAPNQVSAVLGLGALICVLLVVNWRQSKPVLLVLVGTAVFLVAQSALTFSRGGLVGSAGAMAIGVLPLLRDPRISGRLVILGTAGLLIIILVLIPRLQEVTGGVLMERFTQFQLSNREQLMEDDMEVFWMHPLVGVGPGMAKHYREIEAAAHTEYTRLLAEHGLLGACAILLIFIMAALTFWRAPGPMHQSIVLVLMAWSLLFMTHSATRIAAPGFLFGLAAYVMQRNRTQRRRPASVYFERHLEPVI